MTILIFSTLVNFLFFWSQVLVDSRLSSGFMMPSVQGVVLLVMYLLGFLVLLLQRPLLIEKIFKDDTEGDGERGLDELGDQLIVFFYMIILPLPRAKFKNSFYKLSWKW